MVNPKIRGKQLKLKTLEIKLCFGVQTIEIRDTNIVSLTCIGLLATLRLNNLPNLKKIHIDDMYSLMEGNLLGHISCCISFLRDLQLDLDRPVVSMTFCKLGFFFFFPSFTYL